MDTQQLTEAEIRATMSSEQILLERKLTCEAITGAMAFGYQGTNAPPSDEHWLAPFWKIGRREAELEAKAAIAPSDAAGAPIYQVRDDALSWADSDPALFYDAPESERRIVYAAPVAPAAVAPIDESEWRAIFNSTRTADTTFEQFREWMSEEVSKGRTAPTPTVAAEAVALAVYEDRRSCALQDLQFARGLQSGWQFGILEDRAGYEKCLASRAGYVKVLRETRTAPQPHERVACSHDYVRSDRVCIECGEYPVQPNERTYTTKAGESVMGIALRECGDEKVWRHILACNPEFASLLPHEYFPVGTVLTLPPGTQAAQEASE
ncbi:nucleoid-associated protein YgaU [Paraburkholderia unamae]|uniref:hypothetical protein n=1 Tax=Paraburkholderia unamae TaxID=219649 RepID=UPI000DC511EF|nr:hypothetical protein [Paraburkholderia unamae]RAR51651.1 nucleoid-associated protein YgaU [Paraburkholderia unamae]